MSAKKFLKLQIISVCLILISTTLSSAEDTNRSADYAVVPVMLSLFPGLSKPQSTRGIKTINNVHYGIIGNDADRLEGLGMSGFMDIVYEDASALQMAGTVNWVNGNFNGLQMAGVLNWAGGYMDINHWTNSDNGNVNGLQMSGVLNFSSGNNQFLWGQMGGVANIHKGNMNGAQLGGVFNGVIGNINGVQMAGVFNLASGTVNGVQMSGVLNYAKTLNGLQIGVVNVTENLAGVSIGVFNYSEHARGVPLALFSIIRDGEFFVDSHYNDLNLLTCELRHGTKYFYNIYSSGIMTSSIDFSGGWPPVKKFSSGLGYGVKYPVLPFLEIALEGIGTMITKYGDTGYFQTDYKKRPSEQEIRDAARAFYDKTPYVTTIQLMAVYKANDWLSVVGGVSYNIGYVTDASRDTLGKTSGTFDWSTSDRPQWPGFFLGLRI